MQCNSQDYLLFILSISFFLFVYGARWGCCKTEDWVHRRALRPAALGLRFGPGLEDCLNGYFDSHFTEMTTIRFPCNHKIRLDTMSYPLHSVLSKNRLAGMGWECHYRETSTFRNKFWNCNEFIIKFHLVSSSIELEFFENNLKISIYWKVTFFH